MNDLIAAQATPAGRSALAIIRLSGEGSAALVESLMRLDTGRLKGMRRAVGLLYRGDEELDSIVTISWPEGKSYTGEEMVEIICHGVPAISRDILTLLMEHGAREAEPGEFTRRAFLSGALDGVDVVALSALWDGGGSGIAGTFRQLALQVLKMLDRIREELEARIEFQEIHGSGASETELEGMIGEANASLERLERVARAIDGKSRVFIMGPANTGKSTLFNLLAGREHAVVSELPGTTRDGRSVEIEAEGRSILLFDSAGAGGEGLEGEAGRISAALLTDTDRILWLSDEEGAEPGDELSSVVSDVLSVQSRSDLHDRPGSRISSVTAEGMEELRRWLVSSPGEVSLAGLSAVVSRMTREAGHCFAEHEESLAAERLTEATTRLRSMLREEELELCVERALARLCVGK